MTLRADRSVIPTLSVGGRGGKDRLLLTVFPQLRSDSSPLWDAYDPSTGLKYEFKKQANLQWFDIGKYHNLSIEERTIQMVFVLHTSGVIDTIFSVALGDLLQTLTSTPAQTRDGWTWEAIAHAHALKKQYPALQLKVPLKVRAFFEAHREKGRVSQLYP